LFVMVSSLALSGGIGPYAGTQQFANTDCDAAAGRRQRFALRPFVTSHVPATRPTR
jgi:hypothetical protein